MTPNRFRPIALCNVIYKIISKVIANRLKPLQPTLVSEEQTGYVEGRQILNIIQAHEIVHSLKNNKQARMIIQLYLAKTSDKMSWLYIKEVLIAYGFDQNWIIWVMALVTSASFSILLNNSPSKSFRPSRGLRKGDPLSPFLFILMMEGLGKAITSAKREGTIQVQNHNIWEIGNGSLAWFWEDTWQQESNLSREGLDILREETVNKGIKKVSEFWDKTKNIGDWRILKIPINSEESPLKTQAETLAKILEKRKILISSSPDQLRWGRSSEGNFNLKEAKQVVTGYNFSNPNNTWKDLWKHPQWMKIKMFMWMVHRKNILTWENLRKKGFAGPSRCHLCGIQEEMRDHLLSLCTFTSTLWNWAVCIFRQTDRDENDISKTLKNWRKKLSENKTINSAGTLIPSFLIWNVWKERNNIIFKDKSSPPHIIINQLLRQLKETVNTIRKRLTENLPSHQDTGILLLLGLQKMVPRGSIQIASHASMRQDFSQTPLAPAPPRPPGYLKLNTDGASKGNPREAGYGGVIRDDKGNLIVIFHSYLGSAINNMAELMVIEQSLEILRNLNKKNSIIEVDSELTINSLKKIANGSDSEKISHH
eukprot:PITA_03033